jgi:hypothetical protein
MLVGSINKATALSAANNHVDGPLSVRFGLSCIKQHLLTPSLLSKLEQRLIALAQEERDSRSFPGLGGDSKRSELTDIQNQLEVVRSNLAFARSHEQYDAVSGVFDELEKKRKKLEAEVAYLKAVENCEFDIKAEVDSAMGLLRHLVDLADRTRNFATVGEVFRKVNIRLFFGFGEERTGKRAYRRVVGGIVTFGNAEPPISIYEGPTARKSLTKLIGLKAANVEGASLPPPKPEVSDSEGNSLGNANRGDRIRTSRLCWKNRAF